MPSPSLIEFQEKLAADAQLQEKFVSALSRFAKAVTDSGKENGHVFESQDVFRFIQGTFLPESGQAGADSIFVELFVQAAGQSSATSQLSTLNVGQNSELLDALKKPVAKPAPRVATSEAGPSRLAETDSRGAVADQAEAGNAAATPQQEVAANRPIVEPGSADPESAGNVGMRTSPATDLSAAGDDVDDAATAWQESSGDSDAEWNQEKAPWWKFW